MIPIVTVITCYHFNIKRLWHVTYAIFFTQQDGPGIMTPCLLIGNSSRSNILSDVVSLNFYQIGLHQASCQDISLLHTL